MNKILVALVCLLCGLASAQNGKISGQINNSDGQPIDAILISLLSSVDNSLVKTAISEPDGSFVFNGLQDNSYILFLDNDGFQKYQSDPIAIKQNSYQHPTITIASTVTNLNEVVIEKKKAFVENKIDRTVVNVDAMISAAGSDAMDVLEKSPGISIDQNGVITFKGKTGVAVFIDDKPTYLSGSDLEAYLKSLPASTLNQIEFMTNPPAKYDAAGSAGVINIKTKKSKVRGFNGSASARVSRGKRTVTREGINLNYTDGKIRAYGNLNFARQESVNDLNIFRRYKNPDGSAKTLFDQNTMMESENTNFNARMGLDYYVSENTTLGIAVTGLQRKGANQSDVRSALSNPAFVIDSTIVADNRENKTFRNGGVTLNYSREFKGGKKLTADADYLNYSDETAQRFNNFIYQADGSLSSSDAMTGELPSKISIYTFKSDYFHPLKEGSFEAGYKISYSETDNVAEYFNIIGGNPQINYDMSNHFKYDEIINAAYVNYAKNFKRFSFQAGLRFENTSSKGNQLGNALKPGERFDRNYSNIFPTAYVMYKLDSIGNNQLVVDYGKRINRPYYQDLNPFVSPLDKFTFYAGNPLLNPSFAHNLSLSYRYKGIYSTTFSYGRERDNIAETIEINDNEIYYSRPGNIGKSQYLSWNMQSDFDITKWFTTSLYSEVTYSEFESELYTEGLNSSGTFYFLSTNNRFKLSKSWSAELGARYTSEVTSTQFTLGRRSSINIGVQKKVLKDRGSIRLSMNDVFYGSINNGVINNIKNTDANWKNRPDSRFVALGFTYSFGKSFQPRSQERSSSESEQGRVKG